MSDGRADYVYIASVGPRPILHVYATCKLGPQFGRLTQWFSNLSWGPPTTAYFVCLPHLTHLIQLISSLVESARLEMGVAYERDIQNVWWLWGPQDRFENHWSNQDPIWTSIWSSTFERRAR